MSIDGKASVNSSGFFGGGQVGANYQIGSFVIGAVADIAASDIEGKLKLDVEGLDVEAGSTVEWFGTGRVKAGFTPVDRLLVYGTGGVAFGDVKNSISFGNEEESTSDTQVGWTAGAGVEYAVTKNITLFTEYLYVDLGSQDLINYDSGSGDSFSLEADTKFHTVKAGVNFLW